MLTFGCGVGVDVSGNSIDLVNARRACVLPTACSTVKGLNLPQKLVMAICLVLSQQSCFRVSDLRDRALSPLVEIHSLHEFKGIVKSLTTNGLVAIVGTNRRVSVLITKEEFKRELNEDELHYLQNYVN